VTASAPRASSFVIASNGPRSYGAAAYGIDPPREARISVIGRSVVKGRGLKPGDGNVAIVGAGLARNLKLAIGSKLTMLGGAYDGSVAADVLTVIGIFATGAPEIDRHMIEMPLARFQEAFGLGTRINTMALTGHSLAEFQTGLEELHRIAAREGLVLRDWTELQPGVYEHILLDASFSALLYACLISVVTFIILNSLFMSVLERTREFGMLLALGMRPGQIGAMVWIELAILTGLGLAGGLAVGTAITYWLSVEGIVFSGAEQLMAQFNMSSTLYPELNMFSALAGPLAIAIAITLAGFVPYRHVRRLEPVTAMRAA
jgi:ABC-type lipoprotein release transport system permease subunit